jgi:hypothetical protein
MLRRPRPPPRLRVLHARIRLRKPPRQVMFFSPSAWTAGNSMPSVLCFLASTMCLADEWCICRREAAGDELAAAARRGGGHGKGAPVPPQGMRPEDHPPGHQGIQHPTRRRLRATGTHAINTLLRPNMACMLTLFDHGV